MNVVKEECEDCSHVEDINLEEDFRSTPRRPPLSLLFSEDKNKENRNVSIENEENLEPQLVASETREIFPEYNKNVTNIGLNANAINPQVIEEPVREDVNFALAKAKSPQHISSSSVEGLGIPDLDACLELESISENPGHNSLCGNTKENFPEVKSSMNDLAINTSAINAQFKEEPADENDDNCMSIATTPRHSRSDQSLNIPPLDACLETETISENTRDNLLSGKAVEKFPEAQKSMSELGIDGSALNAQVKEEPAGEDCVPITNTPQHSNSAQGLTISGLDACLETETISENTRDGSLSFEKGDKFPEAHKNHTNILLNASAASAQVKEEPVGEDVDYGMPIAKTPRHTSSAQLDDTPRGNEYNLCFESFPTDSALNEYLDGIATSVAPIMPRLRVKPEFALPKPPQNQKSQDNNAIRDDVAMDIDNCRQPSPPPPPDFSSNSNSHFVADGIATPRISLAAISRLRVKSEFSMPPATTEHSADYFNDLIGDKNTGKESGEVTPSMSDDASEDEPIPSDYFDDLLHDKLKERIEESQNNEFEVKYSDQLKELKKDKLRRERKSRKKQKKSKKKSKKRSRSRSLSPDNKTREVNYSDLNCLSPHGRNKRSRLSPSRTKLSTSKNTRDITEATFLSTETAYKIKSEFSTNHIESSSRDTLLQNSMEVDEVLTPKQKREKAIKRATTLLSYLKEKSEDNTNVFSSFNYVSTVRKLPTSNSYVQQHIYENRSPLHSVNNVNFKFSSHAIRFNMEEWGLASLPPNAAKLAKLVGCDAQFIYDKLKTMKIPAKLKKETDENAKNVEEAEEELVETSSSLYSNVMTQTTDDLLEFNMQRKGKGYEIAVQVEPEVFSVGCQTLPTEDIQKGDEAPIMKIINGLNENQLMAIHAFAELITEPNSNTNAMEMYKLQMKFLDIYKMSKIPSALVNSAETPIVNNFTTMTTKSRDQTQICIQSVKGADGRQFTLNDPRSKPAAYGKRNVNDDAGSSAMYNAARHSQFFPGRPSIGRGHSQTYFSMTSESNNRHISDSSPSFRYHQNNAIRNPAPPVAVKHYGRGGLNKF